MKKLILLSLVLIGCSTLKVQDYNRGQTPESQFQREAADCEMKGEQSRTNGGYGGIAGSSEYLESFNRVFDACMRSKGYSKNQ